MNVHGFTLLNVAIGSVVSLGGGEGHPSPVLAEEMVRDSLSSPSGEGYLGDLAARQGDTVEAERLMAAIGRRTNSYGFGEAAMLRARIAALLGRKDEATDWITS